MVRHHVLVQQTQCHPELGPFLGTMRDDGLHIDDFATNGVLLPVVSNLCHGKSLPVHFGGHPHYNTQIIDQLQSIRVFCESLQSDSQRRQVALAGVRGVQKRAREAIVGQRTGHVDHVRLAEPGTAKLIALIDQMLHTHQSLID